jgi:hypothetical protein
MSAEPSVFVWTEFAGNSRGLLARPTLPNNIPALLTHISSIDYKVYDLTTGLPPDEGSLDPADVMLAAPSGKDTWGKDQIGYTLVWPMPGTLISEPNHTYQIVLIFTLNNVIPSLSAKKFTLVWRTDTVDPAVVP